jgi:serine/threonine-protein kinase RsbW
MGDGSATTTSVELVLPSDVKLIDLVHAMSEKMAEFAGFDADEALNVGLALREAVINAIVHGNGQDPDLKVHISLVADPIQLEATIRDEGRGFDPEGKPDPTAEENLLSTSGRGILLMKAFVDEVRFIRRKDQGMEITLTKKRVNLTSGQDSTDAS